MIKRFFVLAVLVVLVVLSGCGSKSMLKLAGAVDSLANVSQKIVDAQVKEAERKAKNDAERKAKEEAKKNRSWYMKLIDLN